MDIKKELVSYCSVVVKHYSIIVHLQKLQMTSDQSVCVQLNRSPSPIPKVDMAPDVNFQYLKHVVIKFICSREDEALQLIRAISTLLEFNSHEEDYVKRYLNYKVC